MKLPFEGLFLIISVSHEASQTPTRKVNSSGRHFTDATESNGVQIDGRRPKTLPKSHLWENEVKTTLNCTVQSPQDSSSFTRGI